MSLHNSRYGVYISYCHRRIFVTKVHLAEETKFYKHIRVSKFLPKVNLYEFFDVWIWKFSTDLGNAVIDIGLSIYIFSYLGILVFCNHFQKLGCLNLFLVWLNSWLDLNKVGKFKDKP